MQSLRVRRIPTSSLSGTAGEDFISIIFLGSIPGLSLSRLEYIKGFWQRNVAWKMMGFSIKYKTLSRIFKSRGSKNLCAPLVI
jgi:hypothetical protein